MKKTFKGLMLGALLAASALVAPDSHAAAGNWTQVTPTSIIVGGSKVNSYYTTLVSGTALNSDLLTGSAKSCWSVDSKVTGFTGSATNDSLTLVGYGVSQTASIPGAISVTAVAAAVPTTTGTHATITGQITTIQARATGVAGSSQTVTVLATEIQNCTR